MANRGFLHTFGTLFQNSMNKRHTTFIAALCGICFSLLAEMPRDYYPNTLEGTSGAELKTGLHNLLKKHTRIAYGSRNYNGACTWTVFRKSDNRGNNMVWDMYSNNSYSFPSGSGAAKGMNIEHSVPKSWWGDSNYDNTTPGYPFQYDATYDLHHLTPSDAKANSEKSNYPLGEVITVSFDNGVSKVGTGYANGKSTNLFEPADEYKGDFARMYFYFVTCYQDYEWKSQATTMFAQNSYPTLNAYGLSLLLRWHRQDPVSQKEIDRNNAVYSFQGNRNPFIDYPNMVEYIWGDSIDYEFSFSGAHSTTPAVNASSDRIDFGYIADGTSKTTEIYIKGRNLTSAVMAMILNDDRGEFSISPTSLSADELNMTGINLTVTFSPQTTGTRNATLRLTSDELESATDIVLAGSVLSSQVSFPEIVGLKSSYKKSDSAVQLRLNTDVTVKWTVDGKSATHFTPADLTPGLHTVKFTTSTSSGKMRVQIVE